MRSKLAIAFLAIAPVAATTTQAGQPAKAAGAVRFRLVSVLGHLRPLMTARVNGHPMPMMIHSNATLFAQLRHGQAARFGVTVIGAHGTYGIDKPGSVSTLGSDKGRAAMLAVGDHVDRDAPVSIFEVPQDEYGMLGIRWIRQNRVILDYGRSRAFIAPTDRQAMAVGRALLRGGYRAMPIQYDARSERYVVRATIGGVTRRMTIATASSFTIDRAFADAVRLKRGPDRGNGSGPTGTHVANYALATPVRVTIGGWTSPDIASGDIEDTYGYSDEPRPANPAEAHGGELGGEFLLRTAAVIDFGRGLLYVRAR